MPWIYRAVQDERGSWVCRFGLTELDRHPDLHAALAHIRTLVAADQGDQIYVHGSDGSVDALPFHDG